LAFTANRHFYLFDLIIVIIFSFFSVYSLFFSVILIANNCCGSVFRTLTVTSSCLL